MPATVTYKDGGPSPKRVRSRELTVRVRRGYGPIPEHIHDGMCVLTTTNDRGDEIERNISTSATVGGLAFSQKGSLYVVGFFDNKNEYHEHMYPSDNVEWIKKEGNWEGDWK